MEKKLEPNWPFSITNILSGIKGRTLGFCPDYIKPLIREIFEEFDAFIKSANYNSEIAFATVQRDGVANLMYATQSLTEHTYPKEELNAEELLCFQGIIGEFEAILDQPTELMAAKAKLIRSILSKNVAYMPIKYGDYCPKKHKILASFKDLLLIIHLINENYEELLEKGFSSETVWDPFVSVIKRETENGYHRSDEEKMRILFEIINGNQKFQPIYETSAVGYAIMPQDFAEDIKEFKKTDFDSLIILPKTDTQFVLSENGYQTVSSSDEVIKKTYTI